MPECDGSPGKPGRSWSRTSTYSDSPAGRTRVTYRCSGCPRCAPPSPASGPAALCDGSGILGDTRYDADGRAWPGESCPGCSACAVPDTEPTCAKCGREVAHYKHKSRKAAGAHPFIVAESDDEEWMNAALGKPVLAQVPADSPPTDEGTGDEVLRYEHCEVFVMDGRHSTLVTVVDGDWAVCEEHGRVYDCAHLDAINAWCMREFERQEATRAD